MKFSFSETLILFGFFQALLFGVVLWTKQENKQANRFLSLLLFCLGYENFIYIVVHVGLYDRYFWLHLLPYGLAFVYGPAFYFYVRSLTSTSFRLKKKHLFHFSLVIIDYLHSFYHLIFGRKFPQTNFHINLHAVLDEISGLAVISVLVYITYSWRLLKDYKENLPKQLSYTDHMTLQWLRKLLIALSASWVLSAIYTIARLILDFYSSEVYFFQFLPVIFISWLGIANFQQRQTQVDMLKTSSKKDPPAVIPPPTLQTHTALLKNTLEKEQLYLNPELNIRILEEKTQLSAKEISVALNQGLQKNFYLFVNEYRIAAVKKRLIDPGYDHLTIFGIALETGFKSKATFNRLFKTVVGVTPKQYRDEQKTLQVSSKSCEIPDK